MTLKPRFCVISLEAYPSLGRNLTRNCLVVGGAGFIGSHIAEALLKAGYGVRILDNFSTGTLENIKAFQNQIEVIHGDIRDPNVVQQACEGMDAVYHEAAMASVNQCTQAPDKAYAINVTGTVNVFESARQAGVKRIMLASSAAVYGLSMEPPVKYETLLPEPISFYGLHKAIGEQYGQQYAKTFGLDVVCFRYFNVYGPRQSKDSHYSGVISIFVNRILENLSPIIYGDGKQTRDFVHVKDIAKANVEALNLDKPGFMILNLASGHQYSILDILDCIRDYTKIDFDLEYRPERRRDLRYSAANIEKAMRYLSFKPSKTFNEGLIELIDLTRQEIALKNTIITSHQVKTPQGKNDYHSTSLRLC